MAARQAGDVSRTRVSRRLKGTTFGERRKSRRLSSSAPDKKSNLLRSITEHNEELEEDVNSDSFSELESNQRSGSSDSTAGDDGAVEHGVSRSMMNGSISISSPVVSEIPFMIGLEWHLHGWKGNYNLGAYHIFCMKDRVLSESYCAYTTSCLHPCAETKKV